jgi:biopolymer transport protein ExbD
MKLQTYRPRTAKIELLPLMDCMFLILIFFVYALMSMVVHQGVPINLPSAVTTLKNQDDYVSIGVNKEGTYFYNKESLPFSELHIRLEQLVQTNKDPKIYISSDKQAQHGWILALLDEIRKHNIAKVSFETKERNQ